MVGKLVGLGGAVALAVAMLVLFGSPFPQLPLPTFDEMATTIEQQPYIAIQVLATIVAWLCLAAIIVLNVVGLLSELGGRVTELVAPDDDIEDNDEEPTKRPGKRKRKVSATGTTVTFHVAPRPVEE